MADVIVALEGPIALTACVEHGPGECDIEALCPARANWQRINDDAHQWGWTGETVTGDPRVYGRVYLATNGRGIQYGEPV